MRLAPLALAAAAVLALAGVAQAKGGAHRQQATPSIDTPSVTVGGTKSARAGKAGSGLVPYGDPGATTLLPPLGGGKDDGSAVGVSGAHHNGGGKSGGLGKIPHHKAAG